MWWISNMLQSSFLKLGNRIELICSWTTLFHLLGFLQIICTSFLIGGMNFEEIILDISSPLIFSSFGRRERKRDNSDASLELFVEDRDTKYSAKTSFRFCSFSENEFLIIGDFCTRKHKCFEQHKDKSTPFADWTTFETYFYCFASLSRWVVLC